MQDLLIQNAMVIDGSGAPPFAGAVSVADGVITGVYGAPAPEMEARERIDAGGQAVCPGFVDAHTHSDLALLADGRQPSSITQGVTTEIIGQDGLSYAPLSGRNLESFARYMEGLNGDAEQIPLDFHTAEEYLCRFAGNIGVNLAWLAPHGALRLEAAGFANRMLTGREMDRIKELLRACMQQGARGLSTGLSYFPGAYCDTTELVELCGVVREEGGVYVTHLRTVFEGPPFDPVEEALEIARRSGVKLHFSHYRTGGKTLGRADDIMEKIDAARREGLDITLELYPYPFGASYAAMFLPPWASEGGYDAIMQRLGNEEQRGKIARYIDMEFADVDAVIAYAGIDGELMGRRFSEVAAGQGVSKGAAVAELLLTQRLKLGFRDLEPGLSAHQREVFAGDIFNLLSRPGYMVGSDAIHLGEHPHPRGWGCFAKLLRMARETGYPLHTLIQRMTQLPCRRFRLGNRGELKRGFAADLVVFDPDTVADRATVEHPRRQAEGVSHVLVGGAFALREGEPTGALWGRVL